MSRSRRSPKGWVAAVIASSLIAISYHLYNKFTEVDDMKHREDEVTTSPTTKKHKSGSKYTSKSIALTLSHSVLSSSLPLNDILLNSENVTFILPPNLSLDDLECNISDDSHLFSLPQTLIKNYKLLNCSNIQGYFNLVKNLKPDMLLVCSDDLGIKNIPSDLGRFVKEIVTVNQDRDDVYSTIGQLFIK